MDKQKFYDRQAKTYTRHDRESELRYRRAVKLAAMDDGAAVLDVGCKFAYLRDLLSEVEVSAEYFGMEISAETVSQIPGRDDEHFKVGDVMDGLPFADGSFDFLFALEIMEHVESPTFLLREIKRTLKPNGALILSVPNPYCWVEIYGNLRRLPESQGHICSFTHQTLSRLLAFNNMAIIDRCGTYFRVPLLRRWTKKPPVVKTGRLFLTRSYIYKIVPLL